MELIINNKSVHFYKQIEHPSDNLPGGAKQETYFFSDGHKVFIDHDQEVDIKREHLYCFRFYQKKIHNDTDEEIITDIDYKPIAYFNGKNHEGVQAVSFDMLPLEVQKSYLATDIMQAKAAKFAYEFSKKIQDLKIEPPGKYFKNKILNTKTESDRVMEYLQYFVTKELHSPHPNTKDNVSYYRKLLDNTPGHKFTLRKLYHAESFYQQEIKEIHQSVKKYCMKNNLDQLNFCAPEIVKSYKNEIKNIRNNIEKNELELLVLEKYKHIGQVSHIHKNPNRFSDIKDIIINKNFKTPDTMQPESQTFTWIQVENPHNTLEALSHFEESELPLVRMQRKMDVAAFAIGFPYSIEAAEQLDYINTYNMEHKISPYIRPGQKFQIDQESYEVYSVRNVPHNQKIYYRDLNTGEEYTTSFENFTAQTKSSKWILTLEPEEYRRNSKYRILNHCYPNHPEEIQKNLYVLQEKKPHKGFVNSEKEEHRSHSRSKIDAVFEELSKDLKVSSKLKL